jgi:NOL1/NOP2/fmu family ribosome biogenesis protein
MQTIRAHLYVKKIGIRIGMLKGADLVPAHDLAMSQWAEMPYSAISVSLQDALQFLRRADFTLDAPKGWKSLSYLNCRLGWVKILPNRINNYYPNNWRILNY